MFTMFLDRKATMPLYEQICRRVKREIESGALPAGTRMPSKRELAHHLETSAVTVGTAYAQLVAEGYLRAALRSGHFVLPSGLRPAFRPGALPVSEREPERKRYAFDLTTGAYDPSLFPYSVWAKLVRDVLAGPPEDLLSAGHPQGSPDLREAIADYLAHYRGIVCEPSRIVVGAGSEYLTSLLVQLFGRKAVYAVEDPGYPKIAKIIASSGGTAVKVALDGAGIDLSKLSASGASIVHVTPSHQFPTGIVMPVGRRRELLAWAAKAADRYVIEDDYDSEFRYAGQPIPALQGLDADGRVVYLNSFAKSLAPSLRVSYMVLPPALLGKFRSELGHYACTVSNIEQATLARFMAEGRFERHLARARNTLRNRRDAFLAALSKSVLAARTEVLNAGAGLHFLLRVEGLSERDLTARAEAGGIRLFGLSSYGGDPADATLPGVVVVGYGGLSESAAAAVVDRLAELWAA